MDENRSSRSRHQRDDGAGRRTSPWGDRELLLEVLSKRHDSHALGEHDGLEQENRSLTLGKISILRLGLHKSSAQAKSV